MVRTVLVLISLLSQVLGKCQDKPNVVIIMTDDMGSNDASYRGSNQFLTPNIDALAYNGVILDRFYTPAMCTPSRSSAMTGKYPYELGMHTWVVPANEAFGLGPNEKLMSNYFKDAGYSTHLIGKWHLGYFQKKYTPNRRGFDSFYGYYNGFVDYYNYTYIEIADKFAPGYDFRRNMNVNYDDKPGTYLTDLFTDEAVKIIKSHKEKEPFFLMINHLAPHAANGYDPMQAPKEEIEKFDHIADPKRQALAAMISKVDESVGKVVEALKEKDALDNTIILFYSDNGAPTLGLFSNAGSNHPFRGQKNSPWEGASRNIGFIYSPLIKSNQRVYDGYFHTADILPTLASAAGIKIDTVSGFDQWNVLSKGGKSPRKDIVNSLDPVFGFSSIIRNQWKLVNGTSVKGSLDGFLGTIEEFQLSDNIYANLVLSSSVGKTLKKQSEKSGSKLTKAKIAKLRKKSTVVCKEADNPIVKCEPMVSPCLFNIITDPCERTNLAAVFPETLSKLHQNMIDLLRLAAPIRRTFISDPNCNPSLHNGTWDSWVPD